LWPSRATVGGILSTNDSGALRLRFGSLRDLVIGVTLALPDGTLAKSGGKVVKNVAGYDLPKLVTGALGTLGVITQATFRLHPMSKASRTISCVARDSKDAERMVLAIQDSKLAHSALQIRFVESMQPQIDVLFEATDAGCAAQVAQLKALLAPAEFTEPGSAVWNARQELYSEAIANPASCALAKMSSLPANLSNMYENLAAVVDQALREHRARFGAVFYATGVGTICLMGNPGILAHTLNLVRKVVEHSGSLMIAHRPPHERWKLDAWGNAGDAIDLMRAVKNQFDPKSTLNPGRFVGGI
jgi:glycolate oxidase FAD binding subunit